MYSNIIAGRSLRFLLVEFVFFGEFEGRLPAEGDTLSGE